MVVFFVLFLIFIMCLRLFASFLGCFYTTLSHLVLLMMNYVFHFPVSPNTLSFQLRLSVYFPSFLNSSTTDWSFVHVFSLNLAHLSIWN